MTDSRAQRLGLEPGSVTPASEEMDGSSRPSEREIGHSIAISLKRIADELWKITP